MTAPDLQALESLTREYAAFQSRKSGLGTALGGFMAIVLVLAALSPNFMGPHAMDRLAIEYLVWVPFLWLTLKWALGRVLYRGLGSVKATPDSGYERQRWFWILGLALFLLAVVLAALYAFALGFLQPNPSRSALCPPPLWILVMPLLYLLPMPWMVRGIEEARAYSVLVGQCILWLVPLFLFSFGPSHPANQGWTMTGHLSMTAYLVLILLIQIWGALAMVRGWKEHRQYLTMLRSLPREA